LYKSSADVTLFYNLITKGVSNMSNGFHAISTEHVQENPFKLIGEEWMLITAGTIDSWNTMTAAWGGLGYLWNRDVSYCFVRPNRYTYQFMEQADYYTLSFFDAKYKDALNYCGTNSGRDVDKAKETGLTPVSFAHQTVSFEQARLVLVCRKLYVDDIKPANFIDETLDRLYPAKQYHRVYIGEIDQCLK
jgi:flavin reductase (DIM6/NTAB) family NADH-FMN oxidoreductase RutF